MSDVCFVAQVALLMHASSPSTETTCYKVPSHDWAEISFTPPLCASLSAENPSPSSRRSFPPSFWDSNYSSPQSRSHSEMGAPSYSMDPYASGMHPGLPHPHAHPHPHTHPHSHPHPSESWAYPQAQAYGPPRPLHELYSPSALEPHYGPLLMPAVRPPHLPTLPSPYEVSKLEPSASWPSLLSPGDVSQTLALNMDAGNSCTVAASQESSDQNLESKMCLFLLAFCHHMLTRANIVSGLPACATHQPLILNVDQLLIRYK